MVGQRSTSRLGTAIILAAGASIRYGSDKKSISFANTTLLQYIVDHYSKVFNNVLVVLREQAHNSTDFFPPNARMVFAPEARCGMSQSLRAGVEQSKKDPWLVVGLMDMPYVKLTTLERLAHRMESTTASVVRPRYHHEFGNPVGFKRDCFSQLCELSGDQGARSLFDSGKLQFETLEVDDQGVLIDIDTPDQLKTFDTLKN